MYTVISFTTASLNKFWTTADLSYGTSREVMARIQDDSYKILSSSDKISGHVLELLFTEVALDEKLDL